MASSENGRASFDTKIFNYENWKSTPVAVSPCRLVKQRGTNTTRKVARCTVPFASLIVAMYRRDSDELSFKDYSQHLR